MISQVERIKAIIDLCGVDDLMRVYLDAAMSRSGHTTRIWAENAPEIARRKFGDCQEVQDLTYLAATDLAEMDRRK
jgi:hypothetical protein